MKSGLSPGKILLFAGAVIASMFLSYLIDDNLEIGWPPNVVRNWQEFGFFKLHGQMVYNPGGFQAMEHPQIYGGMNPACLYPVLFAARIFGWTGLDTVVFHILLAVIVFWSAWRLLGRDNFAIMMAAATILTPGYMRWPKQFDPNALSVLPILPYAVAALAILKKPRMTPVHLMALVAVTLAFMSLNWTTAWVCGPCVFFLLAMSGLNRRGLITLIAAMVVAVPLVVLLSFSAKYGHHAQGAIGIAPGKPSSGILGVIAGYTWGSGGYGEGQSTGRLFLRLAFTNIVGLFPIWLIFIYALARQIHAGVRLSWLVFAPLALTVANLVIMRNYFCHHPWMAGPVLVIGVIFSLAILRTSSAENATDALGKIPYSVVHPVALLCVIYGFAVLAFLRANETEQLALVKLVREHTARSDTIVILKGDSSTAGLAERLDDPLDRHLVVVDNLNDLANQDHCIILSSVAFDNSPRLIAKSEASSDSWLTQVADWFNRSISHRQPGDRMELRDSYYLYAAGR